MTGDFLISLKQADRSYYPLLRGGADTTMKLSLSAARPEQEKLSLEFFFEGRSQEVQSLGTLDVQRPQDGDWDNLELKLSLEGNRLSLEVLHRGVSLESNYLELPTQENLPQEESLDTPGNSRGPLSIVLALVIFVLTLGAAYFMGDYLSSPAPPALGNTAQNQVDETTVR